LKPCLELCQFVQALLKTKVARSKAYSLIGISKKTLGVSFGRTDGVLLELCNRKRMLRLDSCCYKKSHSSPKLVTSLILDKCKPFLVCVKSLLDFPK
jgi:hypothetical protein